MYSDRRGNGQKPPRTKPPGQKPREQLRENLYMGLLSGFFVLGLLKIGGFRDVWRTFGGPRDVWQSVTGGSKLAKNSVTYFMDGLFMLLAHRSVYLLQVIKSQWKFFSPLQECLNPVADPGDNQAMPPPKLAMEFSPLKEERIMRVVWIFWKWRFLIPYRCWPWVLLPLWINATLEGLKRSMTKKRMYCRTIHSFQGA